MGIPDAEERDAPRFTHHSPLQIKDLSSGEIYEARMQNFSDGGIYFESDGLFHEGAKIYICMQHSPFSESSDVVEYFTGAVVWRKHLKRSFYNYGYGIKLIVDSNKEKLVSNHPPKTKESRKHPRKPFYQDIRFSTQKGFFKACTKNISATGIFVASKEKLEVGQQLKLNLPLKEGKSIDIIGQIVWVNEGGFGLKFIKIK
jgi:Tfp pilus assembly protein PilZ